MNEVLWYSSRATGIVSIFLMTAVLVLGMAITRTRHSSASTIVMGVHRSLSLGMSVFLLVHITTAIAESYVDIGWVSLLIPFSSGYSRLLVGIGTLAFDVLIAVVVTSLLRHRLSEQTWRKVHGFSYTLWPLAIIHGVGLGTSKEPLLRGTTIACAVAGLVAIWWHRTNEDDHETERRNIAAQEWS
jgi:DMSO/TMAO reductase YedYZ heme-binding membrane subunit